VGECEPDVDGDGSLGCPKCNTVVACEGEYRTPENIASEVVKRYTKEGGWMLPVEGADALANIISKVIRKYAQPAPGPLPPQVQKVVEAAIEFHKCESIDFEEIGMVMGNLHDAVASYIAALPSGGEGVRR